MWLVLDAIRSSDNRADPSTLENVPANAFMPISLEFLRHFPRGGVFKNHAPYEHHTDRFLKQAGCKYVVIIRHPADHLAALYCHMREERDDLPNIPRERLTGWSFAAAQYPDDCFDHEPELAIEQLIACGYLYKLMIWMTDWIAFRNPAQSRLLRYEDIVSNFEGVVGDLCRFIREADPDDDLMRYLTHVFHHETKKGIEKSRADKYPRGWTGQVGAWQMYFSPENIAAYNVTIERFMTSYPQARHLIDHYPDLMLRERRSDADALRLVKNL